MVRSTGFPLGGARDIAALGEAIWPEAICLYDYQVVPKIHPLHLVAWLTRVNNCQVVLRTLTNLSTLCTRPFPAYVCFFTMRASYPPNQSYSVSLVIA